jgi:diamine N-acetyltransferase
VITEQSITLRPARKDDIPVIAQLAEKIWRQHYTPIIGEGQVNYMLGLMYSESSLRKQQDEGSEFFMAELGGKPAGYISVSKKGPGEYFLNKFYLDTEEQGKGYGKMLFASLLEQYPDLETIRLQVNRKNYKSVNFYFRLGFMIEESKDFDIGGGFSMDDYIMIFRREKK